MDEQNNRALLCGAALAAPTLSHIARGETFYTFPLQVCRLSGATDAVNVTLRRALAEQLDVFAGTRLAVSGEVRSFNNRSGTGSRLVISLFARHAEPTEQEDRNTVLLRGTVCKPTTFRRTPMGRTICDIMLAVPRRYGRSDYLPCIAWGSLAQLAGRAAVGDRLALEGRLQSRRYLKKLGDETVERTAFEVSVIHMDFL